MLKEEHATNITININEKNDETVTISKNYVAELLKAIVKDPELLVALVGIAIRKKQNDARKKEGVESTDRPVIEINVNDTQFIFTDPKNALGFLAKQCSHTERLGLVKQALSRRQLRK